MTTIDLDMLCRELRALDYVRGSPAEDTMWREDDEDARANLAIEGMALTPEDDALFDMMRDERVPPALATQILLRLLGHPDADPALAITPAGAGC
jgi:hypothetical protein